MMMYLNENEMKKLSSRELKSFIEQNVGSKEDVVKASVFRARISLQKVRKEEKRLEELEKFARNYRY